MSSLARRLAKHLFFGGVQARRQFPPTTMSAIEQAVRDCEQHHAGEIRFVIEASLPASAILHRLSPRQRAITLFSALRVWDTEHNNGVLIYVLLADRAVEIVADRGIAGDRVAQEEWDAACRAMESRFKLREFAAGSVAGVAAVADVLARHPPGTRSGSNEQPDAPLLM